MFESYAFKPQHRVDELCYESFHMNIMRNMFISMILASHLFFYAHFMSTEAIALVLKQKICQS